MLEITNERRRSARCRLVDLARVECRRGKLGSGPDVAVGAVDVGELGIRIVSRAPLIAGEEVEILVHGAGLIRSVRRLGKVVWSDSENQLARTPLFAVGIAFAWPILMPTLRRVTCQNRRTPVVVAARI